MGGVTRKDYGQSGQLSPNNPTLRRIAHLNAPESIQATGNNLKRDNHIAFVDAVVGYVLLHGNVRKNVKSVTGAVGAVTEIVVSYESLEDGQPVEETILKGQAENSSEFILVDPDYDA